MWIGGVRLIVATSKARYAGTDHLIRASLLRDGEEMRLLNLDYPTENDHERGDIRAYDYVGPTKLPRRNDKTPELPDGIGQYPSPYPGYGIEFSDGLWKHLSIKLRIHGDDMWIKDNVDLYVQQIRRKATSFDTLDWIHDSHWTYVASWGRDVRMSTDGDEGDAVWELVLQG
jgi:hypothetical protein